MDTIPASLLNPGRTRRRYTNEFKADLVAQCRGLGVSMARVAMAHGINANLLRRWVVEANDQALKPGVSSADLVTRSTTVQAGAFIPVKIDMPLRSELHIEISRGDLQVKVTWPVDAAPASAAWLREVLR